MRYFLSTLSYCLLVCVLAWGCPTKTKQPSTFAKAVARYAVGDIKETRALLNSIPEGDLEWPDAQRFLGEIALRNQDEKTAAKHFEKIPRDGSETSLAVTSRLSMIHASTGELTKAIEDLKYVLSHSPTNARTRADLGNLYDLTGQDYLASQYFVGLLTDENLQFDQMILLLNLDKLHPKRVEMVKKAAKANPNDPAALYGFGSRLLLRGDTDEAEQMIRKAAELDTSIAEPQADLARFMLQSEPENLVNWYNSLLEPVRVHPAVLLFCAEWASAAGLNEMAARTLHEVLQLDPTSEPAMRKLAEILEAMDHPDAEMVQEHRRLTEETKQQFIVANDTGGANEKSLEKALRGLLKLGREWEAWTWAKQVAERATGTWALDLQAELANYPDVSQPRVVDSKNLAKLLDFSEFPEFDPQQVAEALKNADTSDTDAAAESSDD